MHEDGNGKSDTCKDHSDVHEVEEIVPIDADIHKQGNGEFDTHKDNLDAHGSEESISLDVPMHIQGSDEFDTPHEGMEFSDNEDAFNFYNNYALTHGFSVRKDSQDKNEKGIVVRKTYVCSKEGLLKHSKANKIHRGTTRCGCPAKMVIRRLSNDRFVVKTFIADHNHPLAPPTIARMLRSRRKIKRAHAAIEELASDIGTSPRQTYNYISKLDGGHENYFCADMISVQRVESMHAILEKSLYSCLTIFQFLEQYESFLENLRKNELQQDYKAFSTVPVTMGVKVLMRAVDVYTPTVFEWVKIEAVAAINCTIEVISCNDNVHRYNVEACVVTYNTENTTLQCSCRKFEFSGVLCRHAMKVLDRENIKEIPTAYVWRRWTKNAKTDLLNVSSIPMTGRVDRCRTISRYQHLCRTFLHIAEIASKSEEMYQYVIAMQKKTLRSVGNMHMQTKRLCE
ncbi:FAR-RED IMPAIRED RESPONSE 1 protein [Nymphaea thermarum]|nr:FAR-RED IMPAIRED RESPONSE 1 protein [Nymphaea thermarum]